MCNRALQNTDPTCESNRLHLPVRAISIIYDGVQIPTMPLQEIDGRKVEVKMAVPKAVMANAIRTKKVFVGGLGQTINEGVCAWWATQVLSCAS